MIIREILSDDAEGLVRLIKQVENESQYMLFESGERTMEADQQEKNRSDEKRG